MSPSRMAFRSLLLGGVYLVAMQTVAWGGPVDPNNAVFSLDDLPTNPLTSLVRPGAVGWGAEAPFGGPLPGLPAPLAPSPSLPFVMPLAPVATDATIMQTGAPVANVPSRHLSPLINSMVAPPPPAIGYIDALSTYHGYASAALDLLDLRFSVDRISSGLAGTAVSVQAGLHQQPGDIFQGTGQYANPFWYALPPNAGYAGVLPSAGGGGGNLLVVDESALTLTAGMGPGNLIGPGVLAPPPIGGSHDNLDAADGVLHDTTGDGKTDIVTTFSLNPDDAAWMQASVGPAIPPYSAADVWVVTPLGSSNAIRLFLAGASFGLDRQGANTDDIDALLIVQDPANLNIRGLFSLSPGSASLAAIGASPADVFLTDFVSSFATYAYATDLGLLPTDNVDALLVPEPATMALLALGGLALIYRKRR